MIEKILQFLQDYLEEGSALYAPFPDPSLNENIKKILKPINEKFDSKFQDVSIKFISQKPKGKPITLDDLANLTGSLLKSLTPKEYLDLNIECVKNSFNNPELIFSASPIFEKSLFGYINPVLEEFRKRYPEEFLKIVEICFNDCDSQPPISILMNSIAMIFHELDILEQKGGDAPIMEFLQIQSRIFSKLKQVDENKFKSMFNDWTIKLAQLIEGYLKPILKFILNLKCLELHQIQKIKKNQNLLVGQIILRLNENDNYFNLMRIKSYRNAPSHTNISIVQNKKDWKKSKLIFKAKKGSKSNPLEVDAFIFFLDLDKVYRIIHTFKYMITVHGVILKSGKENLYEAFLHMLKENEKDFSNKNK